VPAEAAALVQRAFDALNEGDAEAAAALMHPDVTWPRAPDDGTVCGRGEFLDYWHHRLSLVAVQYTLVESKIADGELVSQVNELVGNRATAKWYGWYRARRRFTFRDGLIAGMASGRKA
jgi:hypothetical protein